jgi:proteasome lid subunit RPN8/RPN11
VITTILPAKNALASSKAYEIAPQELFTMFRRMRGEGLDHMGIYHSHPASENAPSPRDIDLAAYPETPYLIISPQLDAPQAVRVFSIRDGQVRELDIIVVDGMSSC